MSRQSTESLVEQDIARQNAEKDNSVINTAYYWYGWFKTAKNLGNLALSANPSGAVKFAAQLTLQPIANKVAEATGCPSISTAMRVGIACTDPVGSAISYGAQWATEVVLSQCDVSNPHLKAVLKIASQEASAGLVSTVKSSETYKAASDSVVQKFEQTSVGVKVQGMQKAINNQCNEFDKSKTVKAKVKWGQDAVEELSKKAVDLSQKVVNPSVKEKVTAVKESVKGMQEKVAEIKTAMGKKLETEFGNQFVAKVREADVSAATTIRNTRLNEVEAEREQLSGHLKTIQGAMKKSQHKLDKWQQKKLQAEQSGDVALQAQAQAKLKKYQKLTQDMSEQKELTMSQMRTADQNIERNVEQVRRLTFKKLDDKLRALLIQKEFQQRKLEAASDSDKKAIQDALDITEAAIKQAALECIPLESGDDSDQALSMMPALREWRLKQRVIIRVWLPKDFCGSFVPQIDAVMTAFLPQVSSAENDYYKLHPKLAVLDNKCSVLPGFVGHVSFEFPNGEYVSWWPAGGANKTTAVPGFFATHGQDIYNERSRVYEHDERSSDADRAFSFYSLDIGAMQEALAAIRERAGQNNLGWNVSDSKLLRSNSKTPAGKFLSEVAFDDRDPFYSDNATSCVGMVKKLLIAGGLDKLLPMPDLDGAVARHVVSSPENVVSLLEAAERVESATYPDTRELRQSVKVPVSDLFKPKLNATQLLLDAEVQEISETTAEQRYDY